MLILTRRPDESIYLGDKFEIEIKNINNIGDNQGDLKIIVKEINGKNTEQYIKKEPTKILENVELSFLPKKGRTTQFKIGIKAPKEIPISRYKSN